MFFSSKHPRWRGLERRCESVRLRCRCCGNVGTGVTNRDGRDRRWGESWSKWGPHVQPPTMEPRSKDDQDLIGLTTTTYPPEVRVCVALTRVYELGLYSAAVPAGRRADNNKKYWYRRLGTLLHILVLEIVWGGAYYAPGFDTPMPSHSPLIDMRTGRVLE